MATVTPDPRGETQEHSTSLPSELPCVVAQGHLISTQVLREVEAIHQVLHRAAERRLESHSSAWIEGLVMLGSIASCIALLVYWPQLPLELVLVLALAVLAGTLYTIINAAREWTRRDVDTMKQLIGAAAAERPLIRSLLPFSRASLLHAAATARAAEHRVGSRLTLFLGANRAGGLMGGLLVLLGALSAGKYLQDMQIIIPWLNTPMTATGVIATVLLAYGVIAALLFAGHSVNALPHYAELLDRVASLKKNLKDDEDSA